MPESEPEGWRLRLLGDFALRRGEVQVRRLRAQKYAHLLAFLAISPNIAHSREELSEIFWPDEPLENGRTCLRTALSSLRKQLEDPDLFLEGQREVVRLRPGAVATDVAEFEEAARKRRPEAKQLYSGPFLPGCYYDWALDERHRLEAVYEGLPDDGPKEEAAPWGPAKEASRYRVPNPFSAFYGREGEIAELRGLLRQEIRLVSIVGLGGVGKTRLAIEFGRSLTGRVAFVELAEVSTPEAIPLTVAEAIGLRRDPGGPVQRQLEQELETEPTTLILDNFEQLVEVGGTAWVAQTLESIGGLSIVVTSRLALALVGETVYPVPPLSEQASVRLFVDRARSVLPDFSDSNLVPDLCDRLDRLPLAIELCASWASVLSSSRMMDALSKRFDLVKSRKRNVPERHQSLRAVLEWSCPPEGNLRPALARLGLLRGTWSLDAAEALIGDEAAELLDRLWERSLVQRSPDGQEPRFSLLETVREFALEQLSESEMDQARIRHNGYYCRLAGALAAEHRSDLRVGFGNFEREHPNILAAFEFGISASGEVLEQTIVAFDLLRWCWWVRGYEEQIRVLTTRIAEREPKDLSPAGRASLMLFKGRNAADRGRFEDAVGYATRSAELWSELDLPGRVSSAMQLSASYRIELGDFDGAVADLRRALDLVSSNREAYNIVQADLAALLLRNLDKVEEARQLYLELLEFWRQRPEWQGHVAVISGALAECSLKLGDPAKAAEEVREAIHLFGNHGELVKEGDAWFLLAACLDAQGRSDEAERARATGRKRRAGIEDRTN